MAQRRSSEDVEDPRLQGLEERKLYTEEGTICELQTYERRYNSRGEQIWLQSGRGDDLDLVEDESMLAAPVLTRFYSRQRKLSRTQLAIKSPHIKQAMREVIRSYPGINIETECPITIIDEPYCLFHFRVELKEYASKLRDRTAKEHVLFCLKYTKKVFRGELANLETLQRNPDRAPGLGFRDLWMVLKPGTIMYHRWQGDDTLYRLRSIVKATNPEAPEAWVLEGEMIMHDGEGFRWCRVDRGLSHYDGYRPFTELENFPLEFHHENRNLRRDLLARSRKYISMSEVHHCTYDGGAISPQGQPFKVHGKIIIDTKEYYNGNAGVKRIDCFDEHQRTRTDLEEHLKISEEDALLCSPKVAGYALGAKQWGYFDLSKVELVAYNKEAFSRLVLPSRIKTNLSSLVQIQEPGGHLFDDMIAGKGRGIIVLLHGCPGVGKTYTAEIIAEYSERPLYPLGTADLGMHVYGGAERSITQALARATRWNAIVLLDEADVFMQERGMTEMSRNEQVSVLLRALESFEGIMFLTTNRVETIDPAFKSRIHLSIAYPTLSATAKREIWQIFILKGTEQQQPRWMTGKFLEKISNEDVNGRDIKNIVRVAHALAASGKRSIEAGDILQGLQSRKDFEKDFIDAVGKKRLLDHGMETTRPIKRAKSSQANAFNDNDVQNNGSAEQKSWLMKIPWPW